VSAGARGPTRLLSASRGHLGCLQAPGGLARPLRPSKHHLGCLKVSRGLARPHKDSKSHMRCLEACLEALHDPGKSSEANWGAQRYMEALCDPRGCPETVTIVTTIHHMFESTGGYLLILPEMILLYLQ